MNINLNVLTDALAAMQMLREVADPHMTTIQFMQALKATSALNAEIDAITKAIKVEVQA